ncbi:uncharacterized protein KLTH0F11462g [Lachancea thermotolerans CBS 6340]|uniref:KLTH0F11462p n=1 Tax=Lachancea thermotolerans (strain ATCC 56472 / CBS 6340 / NRRL Y-8284) TaxID=559295 RepID=C5DLA8_LACTC|nr:KLTH0F11462p [Lachancea thermotolerans CBS 6340]CAR24259.1 KLTH0F11462p [Lachancea thermotolerans CBS 6340]
MKNLKDEPFKLAVLGGCGTGKSSLVSRLTVDMVHEVHYPTRKQNNWLFTFEPENVLAKTIMDEQPHKRRLLQSGKSDRSFFKSPQITPHILLSPVLFQAFAQEWTEAKALARQPTPKLESRVSTASNRFYTYQDLPENGGSLDQSKTTLTNSDTNILRTQLHADMSASKDLCPVPSGYKPPNIKPVTVDVVDTPGFKPDMVVPFLEVSMFRNLDKDVLKGLANEPRRPVSTTSLLVASGASELNGKINGYIFVYSAVPELNKGALPPGYDSTCQEKPASNPTQDPDSSSLRSVTSSSSATSAIGREVDGGLSLLTTIRNCILDAWSEFRDYQDRWSQGKEGDVYSLMYSFKQMWKNQNARNEKLKQLRSFHTKPNALTWDASSPDSPPPCIIICTHVLDQLASPLLIERGKELAIQWGCTFVGVDTVDDYNVDVALGLILREAAERENIIKMMGKGKSKAR